MDEIPGGVGQQGRRWRRATFAAAAGVGITLGAAGIAAAATDRSPSPSGGATAQTADLAAPPLGPDRRGHRGGGFGRGLGERGLGMGGALHGELVVPKATGGYRTVRVQRGVVTAVSATSLTVNSADGFSSTYVLTASTLVDAARDGIGTVKKGDNVGVEATVASDTATADHVRDLTTLKAQWQKLAPQRKAPTGTPVSPSSYDEQGDARPA